MQDLASSWKDVGPLPTYTISLKIFKVKIWPGHGKMPDPANPHNLTKNFKVKIWPWHGKMSDPPKTNQKRTIIFSCEDFYTKYLLPARVTLVFNCHLSTVLFFLTI